MWCSFQRPVLGCTKLVIHSTGLRMVHRSVQKQSPIFKRIFFFDQKSLLRIILRPTEVSWVTGQVWLGRGLWAHPMPQEWLRFWADQWQGRVGEDQLATSQWATIHTVWNPGLGEVLKYLCWQLGDFSLPKTFIRHGWPTLSKPWATFCKQNLQCASLPTSCCDTAGCGSAHCQEEVGPSTACLHQTIPP